jgi:hypothetical protein
LSSRRFYWVNFKLKRRLLQRTEKTRLSCFRDYAGNNPQPPFILHAQT